MSKTKSPSEPQLSNKSNSPNRRQFLGRMGGATAATIAAGSIGLEPFFGSTSSLVRASDIGPMGGVERADRAKAIRDEQTQEERNVPIPDHPDNNDEERYGRKFANYSKGLRHDSIGEVDLPAYNALLDAIRTGTFASFESLRPFLGCPDWTRQRRLVNPLSGYAFDLEGTDSHQLKIPAAPAFASAEEAGEMVELYWMTLLRDVRFDNYDTNATAQAAADDLSNLSDFRGPKVGGRVTTQTLFRDTYPGCTRGPYISQFLLQPAPFGAQRVDQQVNTNRANLDYMTNLTDWLDVQNGCQPTESNVPDGRRFIRNGRDISAYVHIDVLFQAYFVAALILLSGGYLADAGNPYGPILDPGSGRPLPPGADGSLVQVGFGTFGGPALATLVCEPATRALKDVWYQKWLVHRRLRPEEFGGRVEVERQGRANYPIHPDLTNTSTVLNRIFSKYGSYLLPQAFPEGSPMHTAYGSGHATVAGACVTMLKAFFDESAVIQNPVMINPADGGQTLVPYTGPDLRVGGELNKLASNISQGRNIAGVHWRTDAVESNKLGEQAAINMLADMFETYREPFSGFSLRKFDGTTITIAGNPVS